VIPAEGDQQGDSGMMGRQDRDQRQLFYDPLPLLGRADEVIE
jgi:hypothetical protein